MDALGVTIYRYQGQRSVRRLPRKDFGEEFGIPPG
jgi:hypothetical protein